MLKDYSPVKYSFMIFAFASPTTLIIASAGASLMRFTLLNSFSRAFLVLSPIPFISSKAEATCRLLRLSRWKVMANLCTSSCICVSRRKRGEFCLSPIVCGGKPYSSSDVRCFPSLASPAIGISRFNSSIISFTALICPFPPSVIRRSGRGEFSSIAR